MGSRIQLNLNALLNSPNISVKLGFAEWGSAQVEFRLLSGESSTVTFDYHTEPDGKIALTADFNLFRYIDDRGSAQMRLLKMLYEHSIPFTVYH